MDTSQQNAGPLAVGRWQSVGTPFIFANKVLLEHSHTHFSIICGCFHTPIWILSRVELYGLDNLKYLLFETTEKQKKKISKIIIIIIIIS